MPDTTLTSAELDEIGRAFDDASPNEEIGAFLGNGAWASAGDVASFRRLLSLARAGLEAGKAEESMRERAALACEAQKQGFLSPQYASNQPLGSMLERFACDECAAAIRALPLTGGDKP